ncbi:FeS-binding protein [Oceanidesulfovibrio marinus]|uniref:FeS-binding protein n=1 Tax=Oceanidesulfovibrio marinus TaxID=370038 RepID=A0ABX6NJD9_9BACT|nr:FeS-binding protein [Oceanidesulfovibrio marinus]QJT09760.1 FeS-binding protein [Oceanidesulfovibrio marinus]
MRTRTLLFALLMAAMAISGFGQMPIFKRYYIADIPGMAWTADYYFTHMMHYAGGAILLALLGYAAVRLFAAAGRVTLSGWLRIGLWALIAVTGLARVTKNLPDMHLGPELTMAVDVTHLAAVMLLGLTALMARLLGRGEYLRVEE